MKPLLSRIAALILLALPACGYAAEREWKWESGLVPDAGFDVDAAQIARVTSLAGSGEGSLREALKSPGPKIVVFEVGGVIDLAEKNLEVAESQVVIAGQTAPAPGITLIRGGVGIKGNQVVLQHIRVRPGDAGKPKRSGWQPDGITTSRAPADVWIDHCSATWSVDENISASTSKTAEGVVAQRICIRNCIIAEGLSDSTHAKGPHSKGTLVLDGTKQVAIVGNLYASNTERNPLFKLDTSGVVVNNVIVNPGQRAIHASVPDGDEAGKPKAKIAVVGNVVFFGKATKTSAALFEGIAEGHFSGNEGYTWLGEPLAELRQPFAVLPQPPLWPEGLKARSTSGAIWHVARFAGARPAERDAIDTRIVREALTGAARIIDSQDDVGGYPAVAAAKRVLDVPDKGRRAWLEAIAREVTFGVTESRR